MQEINKAGMTFKDAKLLADVSYQDVKNGFIGFGYYLRAIRDGALWKDSGYGSFNGFLDAEYGRDKSWASRCINLYDKFGVPVEPGELPRLGEQYGAYNVSQLIEMIPMQEELREQVTPDMPVKAIRALKPRKVATVATPEPQEAGQQLPDPAVIHFTAGNRTIDNAYGATIAAAVRAYLDDGYARPEKECGVTAFGLDYKVLKRPDTTVFYTGTGRTAFDVENARLEEEYRHWHRDRVGTGPVASQDNGPAAESQQGPGTAGQQTRPEKSGKCIHQPGYDCTLEEAHKLTQGTGEDCSQACCWDCVRRGDCKLECYSSERRPELVPEERGGESAAEVQQEVEDAADVQQEPGEGKPPDPDEGWGIGELPQAKEQYLRQLARVLVKECGHGLRMTPGEIGRPSDGTIRKQTELLGLAHHGAVGLDDGADAFPSDDMIEFFRDGEDLGVCSHARFAAQVRKVLGEADKAMLSGGRPPEPKTVSEPAETVSDTPENVIDGEFTEVQEPEEDIQEPEESLTELQIAQGELEQAKRLLEKGLGCGVDENDIHIRRLKTTVCAWASYVCDLDSIVNPPPKPVQPELPVLRNNDQRKEWVNDYKSWGLWYRDGNIDVNYYKYDFVDGTRLVATEYPQRELYWVNEQRDEVCYSLLEKGKAKYGGKGTYDVQYTHSPNSMGELVEFLKKIQRKG